MLTRIILIFIVIQSLVFAQTGKIVGTVSDLDTGEPLIGANVLIEGTYLGAATDVNGEYIILNVPPGTYVVKALYVGYRDVVFENIQVSVNLTTTLNLQLQTDAISTDVIRIVADKPLVNKNITNSTSILSASDIENLPVRNVNNIIAKEAGVVQQGNNLFVRGSRADATAYYIDGVKVNNPVFGGAQTALVSNAIEEIQFQAGGYTAEYGGANGGIISTHSKTGSDEYKFNVELITDNFASVGTKYLGGYSYGYSEYTLTAGGPVIPGNNKLKFFVAGNNLFRRSPAQFYEGVDIKGIKDPSLGADADSFDVYYPDGYAVNQAQNTYNIQGNLTYDLNPITLKVSGTYQFSEGRDGELDPYVYTFPNYIREYNSRSRFGMNETNTITTSLKLTHVLSPTAFYDVIVSYFSDYYVNMDPVFKHNITAYGDSIENANAGYNMRGDSDFPLALRAFGWQFKREPESSDYYRKQNSESFTGKLNLLVQATKNHEIKAGGEIQAYTLRRYAMDPTTIAQNARSVADGEVTDIYSRLDNYGYNVYGNKSDDGLDAPKQPIFAGAYVQDKMEFSDLIINAGIRLDYIDIDNKEFKDPTNVMFNENDKLDEDGLQEIDPYIYISPRLGFSFPVTESTIFHAQYGKFIQQSRLRDVYQGYNLIADNIKGGFAISQPVGFGLKPERTTSYEIGFKKQLGEVFAFDITAFYKDIKDQIQIRSIYADPAANHNQYYAWVNGDFSTTRGIELKMDLRRTNRLSGSFDYTFSNALGTGSNPSTGFRQIWQSPTATPFFPQQVAPLDFNQTHRGSVNLDYRFSKDDGPELFGSKILSQFGANFLFSFNSGTNFTRWEGYGNARTPTEALNSSVTPWVFQVDARLDKSFDIGPVSANMYIWVTNLLNRKNATTVFNTTGNPSDDGWLGNDLGVNAADGYESYGEDDQGRKYSDIYRYLYKRLSYDASNFLPPREVRLGLRLDF